MSDLPRDWFDVMTEAARVTAEQQKADALADLRKANGLLDAISRTVRVKTPRPPWWRFRSRRIYRRAARETRRYGAK